MRTTQSTVEHTEEEAKEIAFQMYLEKKDARNNCIVWHKVQLFLLCFGKT